MCRLICCTAFILLGTTIQAKVIYVDADAEGREDGSSWRNAYRDLQDAIRDSQTGDEIWVADGVYYPTNGSDRFVSFRLLSGVEILGGFSGLRGGGDLKRDWIKNPTILSGNIGDAEKSEDNTFRVVEAINVDSAALLDGFIIRDGFNDCGCPNNRGGGMYSENNRARIANCRFVDNVAGGGAGVWNQNSRPTFENCAFINNQGRGMTNVASSPLLMNCVFKRNTNSTDGGAMACVDGSSPVLINCRFIRNRCKRDGGAYYGSGNPVFVNCEFIRNKITGSSTSNGGAMVLRSGRTILTNCTFVNNHSSGHTGGITTYGRSSTPVITNCMFWGNTSRETGENAQIFLHAGTIDYSCVEGWTGRYGGRGNFGDDPMVINLEKSNTRLRSDSPAVNAGDSSVVTEETDLDGNPRIVGRRVDIGAYENICRSVRRLRVRCRTGGVVKAKARTRLPEGSTVRFVADDGGGGDGGDGNIKTARVDATGQAVTKFKNQTGLVTVCIEGCPASCQTTECP